MAAKKQKANGIKHKARPVAENSSPLWSSLIGTMLDMTVTTATLASVLLCLIVAKHFT